MVIFDINKGLPLEVLSTCQMRAVWSMDISWDDSVLAVGTEDGTIGLYNLQKMMSQSGAPKASID